MRKASYWLCLATCLVALLFCSPLIGNSQNRERFVISAKAGGINAVTGRASVHGKGTSEWQHLTIKRPRPVCVKTGRDGPVEMLLIPVYCAWARIPSLSWLTPLWKLEVD